jgi:RNase P subunit RPR2
MAMKELTDFCEHCGNLNRTGALHCDACGKGLSANLAAKFRAATRNAWTSVLVFCVSAALTAFFRALDGDKGGT